MRGAPPHSRMSGPPLKLSSRPTRQFWEVPVVHEDSRLLAINKPPCLLTSPDRYDPNRPNLMRMIHDGIREQKPWAAERGLTYLANAHRLDFETSGILLLARDKPTLVELASLFGNAQVHKEYTALAHGNFSEDRFEVEAPISRVPAPGGFMKVDRQNGKKALTRFEVMERFKGCALLKCIPVTGRTHQIRVHLRYVHHPILGDSLYLGKKFYLSSIKEHYRLKPGKTERPLIGTTALHAEKLQLTLSGDEKPVAIEAPRPKDLRVAIKYLREFAAV